jgi:nitrite reductase/ring-hydroxylating ferredoxin subunit
MSLVAVATLDEIPPGKSLEAIVDAECYVLCNHQGTLHALQGICPHRNAPLGAGNFADGRIICPYHGWEFDCVTGEYDYDPRVKLRKYPVVVDAGQVWIEIDA